MSKPLENRPCRILIADDININIAILRKLLRNEGTIDAVNDGAAVLRYVATQLPDLILLDIMMPEMDGYAVCRYLKTDPRTQEIPIIFITALDEEEDEYKGLELGAVDYITKPFKKGIVLARVRSHLQLEQQKKRLRQQQQALQQANHRNLMILDTAAEGIYGTDRQGRLIFINQAALKMMGCQSETVIGKKTDEILRRAKNDSQQKRPSPGDTILAAMEKGETKHYHAVFKPASRAFPVEYSVAPAFEQGQVMGAVVVFTDITIRQQMEAKALQNNKLKAFSVLSGGLAHDLNNLLTTIIGYIELTQLDGHLSSQGVTQLTKCMQACLMAKGLADQFLTISEADIDFKEKIDIDKSCRQALNAVLANTSITYQLELDRELGRLEASPLKFIQLLTNIIQNSCAAMPNGGLLKIRVENDFCCLEAEEKIKKHYLKISIQDQGTGITLEDYPKIFDPYFSSKPRGAQKGMGLGLSICQAIVTMHQGQLTIHSTPGLGTTVHIYLPTTRLKTPS